jgi:hypothetical protein
MHGVHLPPPLSGIIGRPDPAVLDERLGPLDGSAVLVTRTQPRFVTLVT